MLEIFLFCTSSMDYSLSFIFDFLSTIFFSSVSIISFVVFLYRVFYIRGGCDRRRFTLLVFLFVLSMFFLVFSGNFIMTIVGWDGLGLVSFCLVVFYPNSSSLESGLITVFRNRLGDIFFLMTFFFFSWAGCWFFDFFLVEASLVFCLFLFFGAITKRAQVPFSAWLPAAMAAPTPVSSLVHSSTLVTAGIFVLIRFNYLFCFLGFYFFKLFFLLTMVFGGFIAILEMDFKKIVAISTLRQLGIMAFLLSIGMWTLTFIHIIIHAFFKRILFLATGSLMGQLAGGQDSRLYGGFVNNYSSFLYFSVSCFCLSGFPFFIGFYSKDFIIAGCGIKSGIILYIIFLVGCSFTVCYRLRLVCMGYVHLFSSFSFMSSLEDIFFIFPVSFLFFVGWVRGGVFYWMFLVGRRVFLNFFDLLVGIVLLFLGGVMFVFLMVTKALKLLSLFMINMRWISGGLFSSFFTLFTFHEIDSRWIEMAGARGVSNVISLSYSKFDFFGMIRIGSLILVYFVYISISTYFFSWN